MGLDEREPFWGCSGEGSRWAFRKACFKHSFESPRTFSLAVHPVPVGGELGVQDLPEKRAVSPSSSWESGAGLLPPVGPPHLVLTAGAVSGKSADGWTCTSLWRWKQRALCQGVSRGRGDEGQSVPSLPQASLLWVRHGDPVTL